MADNQMTWADRNGGLAARLRSEFLEMPGLQLTSAQAARLFELEPSLCEALLNRLVIDGVLSRMPDGRYCRA